jgi:hypothetical protein
METSMATLRVDSSLIPGVNAPITLDALLSAVEPVLGQSGRIVTALRINGVDEPAFREPDILGRSLVDVDEIDLDTTPVSVMASYALDDALRYLPDLSGLARDVATGLRSPHATDQRAAIGGLADNLALLTALVHTADLWARQAGLAASDWLGDDVAAVERVAASLETATWVEDWVSAADTLEYDLTAALGAWQDRLAAGRVQVQAFLPTPTA